MVGPVAGIKIFKKNQSFDLARGSSRRRADSPVSSFEALVQCTLATMRRGTNSVGRLVRDKIHTPNVLSKLFITKLDNIKG